jgi:hypothetical protein
MNNIQLTAFLLSWKRNPNSNTRKRRGPEAMSDISRSWSSFEEGYRISQWIYENNDEADDTDDQSADVLTDDSSDEEEYDGYASREANKEDEIMMLVFLLKTRFDLENKVVEEIFHLISVVDPTLPPKKSFATYFSRVSSLLKMPEMKKYYVTNCDSLRGVSGRVSMDDWADGWAETNRQRKISLWGEREREETEEETARMKGKPDKSSLSQLLLLLSLPLPSSSRLLPSILSFPLLSLLVILFLV